MGSDKGIKFVCDWCGQLIEIGRPRFIFRGELFCAYDGGTFDETSDSPRESIRQEIQQLLQILETKSEKELNDEVHYAFTMDLCPSCRKKVYQILERME